MLSNDMSGLVRGLQERAVGALPAEVTEDVGGWWLRHAPSCPRWVGAVLPHGAVEPGELEHRIAEAETFYAGHGAAPRFQISPPVCPDGLDALLAERGYHRWSPASLQVASTAEVLEHRQDGAVRVRVEDRPSPAWFEARRAVQGNDGGEREMLGRVTRPSAYASAMVGNDVVSVGRAVADTGWAGVFSMATLPQARGRGAARAVLAALAEWARSHRADHLYLQMERDNAPALRLYERAGFRELCGYHYRTR